MSTSSVHRCVLCDDIFESKDQLQEHFRFHGSRKTAKKESKKIEPVLNIAINCDVCDQKFPNNTAAIQHKFRKHPTVVDKYHCPVCGMLFTIKGLYDRHYLSHNDNSENKFMLECHECGAQFNNDAARDYHVKTTHNRVMRLYRPVETAPPSKKIKLNNAGDVQSVYFCHLCGSEYIVKFNLQKHLERSHSEQERASVPTDMIRCTICDALFYNRKAYETHNLGHRPYDLYVTNEEQRLRTVTRIDQDFDYRRVQPLAEKYLPVYRNRPKRKLTSNSKSTLKTEDDDLSPPSSPDSSDDSINGDAESAPTLPQTAANGSISIGDSSPVS